MNASLEEPDFLSCSIILTQPIQASRHVRRRDPQLTFAKQLLKDKIAHSGPMAALKPQNNYAAEQAVAKHGSPQLPPAPANGVPRPGPGNKQLPAPHNLYDQQEGNMPALKAPVPGQGLAGPGGRIQPQQPLEAWSPAQANVNPGFGRQISPLDKRDNFPPFQLDEIPEPPSWLSNFIASHLYNLPLTDRDDAILAWFQSLQEDITKLAVRFHAMSPQDLKKKISNADRFRLKLPPVPPKALLRPNKPVPFILPGMDYTEEEIEALGIKDYIKHKSEPEEEEPEETVTVHDHPSVFWGRLLKTAFASTGKTARSDVMDALWFLLDEVSRPPGEKRAAPVARKPDAAAPGFKAEMPGLQPEGQKKKDGPGLKPAQAGPGGKAPLPNLRAPGGDPGGLRRPGQLAAEMLKQVDNAPAAGPGGQRAAGAGKPGPGQLKPKALQAPPKPGIAKKEIGRPGQLLQPQVINGRLEAPPKPKAGGGLLAPGMEEEEILPLVVNGRLAPPQKRKGKHPSDGMPNADSDSMDQELYDAAQGDPYARERQRPLPREIDDELENAIPAKARKEEEEPEVHTNSEQRALLEQLALMQQELAEIQRKLSLGRKLETAPGSDQARNAGSNLKPALAEKAKQHAKVLQAAQDMAAAQPDGRGNKAEVPVKKMPPLQPRKPGQELEKKLSPLQAQKQQQKQKPQADSGDDFEQHIRNAQQAKVKILEKQIQPERLFGMDVRGLGQDADAVPGRVDKRPMMANMVKARPDARK